MSINSLSALASQTIWFSTKEKLNDPFEGIVKIAKPTSKAEKIKKYIEFGSKVVHKKSNLTVKQSENIVNSRYLEDPEDFLKFVEGRLDEYKSDLGKSAHNLGIFSTASDIPDDSPPQVANMLLWAHYGDEFKGFCVKYNL